MLLKKKLPSEERRVATRLDIEKETTPGLVRWRRVASWREAPRTPFHAAQANAVKEKVSAEEATLAKQSAEVKAVADDAQADLDVAMPALNNAVKALDSLTKADITEVKAFRDRVVRVEQKVELQLYAIVRRSVDASRDATCRRWVVLRARFCLVRWRQRDVTPPRRHRRVVAPESSLAVRAGPPPSRSPWRASASCSTKSPTGRPPKKCSATRTF